MIYIFIIPVLFFSIIVHEFAHGYIALKSGDPTAKQAGRLTFNPIPHIDIMGTVILPLMLILSQSGIIFGWAKPIPVNPMNFRDYKKDSVKVAAAGPLSNILLLLCFMLISMIVAKTLGYNNLLFSILFFGIQINLILALFNLLPIPPLDGSHILEYFLPEHLLENYHKISRYGFLLLIIVFITPLGNVIFAPIEYLLSLILRFII